MDVQVPAASTMPTSPLDGVHAIQVRRPGWQAVQHCRGGVTQADVPAPWQGRNDEPPVLHQRVISRGHGVCPMTYSDELSGLDQARHAGVVVALLFQRASQPDVVAFGHPLMRTRQAYGGGLEQKSVYGASVSTGLQPSSADPLPNLPFAAKDSAANRRFGSG